MELKREIYQKLKDWKNSPNGKTALLIEGARRFGKTTIVKKFAKENYKSYILLDFNVVSNKLKNSFQNNLGNLDFLYKDIGLEKILNYFQDIL